MFLSSVRYKEYEGQDQEWALDDLSLGAINLLVGKNATGKSRCLNVIDNIAKVLTGSAPVPLVPAEYTLALCNDDERLTYHFRSNADAVVEETLTDGHRLLLNRSENGVGTIYAAKLDQDMDFQTPSNHLAAVFRRDEIQHPFLQPLFDWGRSVQYFGFGTTLNRDQYSRTLWSFSRPNEAIEIQGPDVVALFHRAVSEERQSVFRQELIHDLQRLDYPIEDVDIGGASTIQLNAGLQGELKCIRVKERGLKGFTDQYAMSQGMFRVLSLLIQLNYKIAAGLVGCVIIDDVGEGLDFDRSCELVELLREKAKKSSIQLIMATNDKFVMNKVPLDEWSVLQRNGGHVKVLNKENSKELFEEFRFTGLSNFSFLEMDFANMTPEVGSAAHE